MSTVRWMYIFRVLHYIYVYIYRKSSNKRPGRLFQIKEKTEALIRGGRGGGGGANTKIFSILFPLEF